MEPVTDASMSQAAAGSPSGTVHPLDRFYARNRRPLPPLRRVDGEEVPEPYKSLLVHESDMTSTLEQHYGGEIVLDVRGREQEGSDYFREVVLRVALTGKPVEFGAIKISLDRFPEEARLRILEAHWPLGRILHESGMAFASRPAAFLQMASDPLINEVLQLSGAQVLYGRRNTLFNAAGEPLAEIVEILPPATKAGPVKSGADRAG
jgi:chorismate-pyruvate lyase